MVRAFDKWLLPWLLGGRKRRVCRQGPRHVMLAVCDHFEPLHGTDQAGALKRMERWRREFPEIAGAYRGADGQPPKHTFFYPVEQYDPEIIGVLAELCRQTGSEVEIHLHHERDTPEGLETALEQGKRDLLSHGLLSRDSSGAVRYGFIHGNWALNHSHPEGRGCGVEREIPILRRTGCYADFTMPSAPSPTQARVINSIGYLPDVPGRRTLDEMLPAEAGKTGSWRDEPDRLLAIQGPLALNWGWRKWGLVPRVENGDLTGANPATAQRLRLAADQGIHVAGREDWVFVKCHTHGGIARNFDMLLGEPMRHFHASIASLEGIQLHYVTAREMANLVHAAEDGVTGDPGDYRDYRFVRSSP
ncbi:MAG: hypothetical protein KDM64_07025 [Verrucomicrobiae bacterium]|nr:hypothetical protein [Verrucomicrobiae bacterium]